ncbi:MAG: hypothetical protein Q9192_008547, partial [Flavoplaca navasiana]
IKREEKADREPETTTVTGPNSDKPGTPQRASKHSRSRSRRRVVSYTGQSEPNPTPTSELLHHREQQQEAHKTHPQDPTTLQSPISQDPTLLSPTSGQSEFSPSPSLPSTTASPLPSPPAIEHPSSAPLDTIAGTASRNRPAKNGKAFPFKLGLPMQGEGVNASMVTLKSVGIATPTVEEGRERKLGEGMRVGVDGADGMDGVDERKDRDEEVLKRPEMERFETAREM